MHDFLCTLFSFQCTILIYIEHSQEHINLYFFRLNYPSFRTVSPGFTIDDIDDALVQKFKTLAAKKGRIDESVLSESKADLMEKLRLTNAGHYTNAAMLLFSKDPDKWQLGSYTKI